MSDVKKRPDFFSETILLETLQGDFMDHEFWIPNMMHQIFLSHTTYSWNIKWQKCAGISGLWVLNEIIPKKYPENMKNIMGAVWKLPAK